MEAYQIAVPVTALAVIIGLSAGTWSNGGLPDAGFDTSIPSSILDDSGSETGSGEASIGRLGSAHDHALFHVVENGSEKEFTSRRFQFNSRYVHLENNKSDIVHKHATGITWKMFLDTVNISASRANRTCVEIYGNSTCGNGSVVLNGEFNVSLDTEISQGDNLLIIVDTENWRDVSKRYMRQRLPEDYRPQTPDGRSI